MYIAYSVLRRQINGAAQLAEPELTENLNPELQLRYQAYQHICHKYRNEIAVIQKYLPGWRPTPPL